MRSETIINISEIKGLLRERCEDNKKRFSKKKFEDFLKFLEIDFYDWVSENLRQFDIKQHGVR